MSDQLERIERLRQHYLDTLVEDPIDGTDLDCDILNSLSDLMAKYVRKDRVSTYMTNVTKALSADQMLDSDDIRDTLTFIRERLLP